MGSRGVDAEFATELEHFKQRLRTVADIQQRRNRLTAAASVRDGRVHVAVNADGVLIETRFAADIDELGYDEIAAAVTAAAQQAAAEVARLADELMAPLQEQRARFPDLSEFADDLPELPAQFPVPRAPTTPPRAPDCGAGPPTRPERADGADRDGGGAGSLGWSL
ncbi:YbaB/EbfC family nucleoid-associated protein [Nocardia sp. BMG51109]|uniref:YbaB/EbfC family nucleoid-associated protein n=1 Tax=Nocardia sp. BMG51109 TaxID=1056816 RepID=UPI00046752C4|nr:YbaB/EbfC family nucleoid-associated protein [Nocardia sp. BMG51109]